MPAIGDSVTYIAVAGDRYPAEVAAVRAGDVVDVDVFLPGGRTVLFTRIARRTAADDRAVWCWPGDWVETNCDR